MRAGLIGATLLWAGLASGCLGADNEPTVVPEECRAATPPEAYAQRAPYTPAELAAKTEVARPDAIDSSQADELFATLAPEVVTLGGRPYDEVSARLFPRDTEPSAAWVLKLEGRVAGAGAPDRHEFQVDVEDAKVERRFVDGKAVPATVQAELEAIFGGHASRGAIDEIAPHRDGAAWSIEWPGCLRLDFSSTPPGEPPTSPHGAAHVFVNLESRSVPEGGVLLYPAGTEGPPRRWQP